MVYFVAWAVFLFVCFLAIPVAVMMDKRKAESAMSSFDESGFAEETYGQQDEGDVEPLGEEDSEPPADFPADELPDAGEPVLDDFSAFDEEFK